ncbi:MAG TPA: SRPBCC domain-containing protein [Candidatus Angelobacter sp.]|nr:SRPBCC domain-containing protein [Candidatus Angelobacter sp.]
MSGNQDRQRIKIEKTYKASINDVWHLWTTKDGIESWWGPDGFTTQVLKLNLRAGGTLRYLMTATGAAQAAFMKKAGMPLTTEGRISYTEVILHERLAYTHLADFIPGVEPYDVATTVEFFVEGEDVRMVLTFDAMHSEEWTQRAAMGHESQLGRLEKVLADVN